MLSYSGAVAANTAYVRESSKLSILDDVYELLNSGDVKQGMGLLGKRLYEVYVTTSAAEWQHIVQSEFLMHPIKDLLFLDPHTERSYRQPRGYSGDAVSLDMAYFPERTNFSSFSNLASGIFKYNTQSKIARALRHRINTLSEYIDEAADLVDKPRILSVACGHCREAELSSALQRKSVGKFVGIDQDPRSLAVARRSYGAENIVFNQLSVLDLVRGNKFEGNYDLIYSAGLFDYLSKRSAQKLTHKLYSLLSNRGKLVIFNITQDYEEIGYFESFMNWSMIGRTGGEMVELAAGLEGAEKASLKISEAGDINSHFHILELGKNG